MKIAEIITIGAELLQGRTLNTNAQYLSRELTQLNFQVLHQQTCDDDKPAITQALDLAFTRSDLVIATGGLGPTPDDITRKVVADYFGSSLRFHKQQFQHIKTFFKRLGREPSPITKSECYFPEVGEPILNQYGIALGFYVARNRKLLVCLPGVPRELTNLFEHNVIRILKSHFNLRAKMHELSASLIGIDEAKAMRIFGKKFFQSNTFQFGSYPMDGRLVFRFRSKQSTVLAKVRRELGRKFSKFIYSYDDISLEEAVGTVARQKKITIATAESCTGGLISKRLTDIAGASRFFVGGVIAYHNHVKTGCLGVTTELLVRNGAVSRRVAIRMAEGVRKILNAKVAVAVTGIAGPGGGTISKPVGLVWVGISSAKRAFAKQFLFAGSRDRIRRLAADSALWLLHKNL